MSFVTNIGKVSREFDRFIFRGVYRIVRRIIYYRIVRRIIVYRIVRRIIVYRIVRRIIVYRIVTL